MPRLRAVTVVHPFPSALDAAVTGLIALVAGGTPDRAALLAVAMLLLQFAIGAANDWADAPADGMARQAKPIVLGFISRRRAGVIAVACALVGLAAAAIVGPAVVAVGVAGLAAGLAYDLGLKPTRWAWLPFAVGFTLLPLFAWLGATGEAPPFIGWSTLLALPAGGAVSLANGLVDLEGDAATGRGGPAVRLGRRPTLVTLLPLHLLLIGGAAASLTMAGSAPAAVWAGLLVGAGLQVVGWLVSRGRSREARLNGWHVQAVGLAVLAGAWFWGMVG